MGGAGSIAKDGMRKAENSQKSENSRKSKAGTGKGTMINLQFTMSKRERERSHGCRVVARHDRMSLRVRFVVTPGS